jgi:hypothetical protein
MSLSTRALANAAVLLLIFTGACATFSAPAHAEENSNDKITCYLSSADIDKDGYAKTGAIGTVLVGKDDLHCPAPWVDRSGDCNDYTNKVHPRMDDIAGNNVDDNCADGIDEPIPYYHKDGWNVTSSSFSMLIRLNHKNWIELQQLGVPFEAEAWIEPLNDVLHPKVVTVPTKYWEPGMVSLDLKGLAASTVHRVRTRFKLCLADLGCSYSSWSPYYYSTTDYLPGTGVNHKRTRIITRAFMQFMDYSYGTNGYLGWRDPDGTGYGASIGENWCSEFYSWVVDPYVTWLYYGPPADIKGITDGFNLFSGLLNPVFAPGVASSGDYLGLDTDGDGVVNHSAMVLDWDKSIGQFWTIEGNLNNAVVIRMRTESQVKVFGIITKSMFE